MKQFFRKRPVHRVYKIKRLTFSRDKHHRASGVISGQIFNIALTAEQESINTSTVYFRLYPFYGIFFEDDNLPFFFPTLIFILLRGTFRMPLAMLARFHIGLFGSTPYYSNEGG
jgi:hypothetical protein